MVAPFSAVIMTAVFLTPLTSRVEQAGQRGEWLASGNPMRHADNEDPDCFPVGVLVVGVP
jgi:hypothetical protein